MSEKDPETRNEAKKRSFSDSELDSEDDALKHSVDDGGEKVLGGQKGDELSRLRREKRLAMNRGAAFFL